MKVICVNTIETGGPQLDLAGNVIGPGNRVHNPPGTEIDVPDEDVPRLLKLGAVRLPDEAAAAPA